jgi:hypothetical protein
MRFFPASPKGEEVSKVRGLPHLTHLLTSSLGASELTDPKGAR